MSKPPAEWIASWALTYLHKLLPHLEGLIKFIQDHASDNPALMRAADNIADACTIARDAFPDLEEVAKINKKGAQ